MFFLFSAWVGYWEMYLFWKKKKKNPAYKITTAYERVIYFCLLLVF